MTLREPQPWHPGAETQAVGKAKTGAAGPFGEQRGGPEGTKRGQKAAGQMQGFAAFLAQPFRPKIRSPLQFSCHLGFVLDRKYCPFPSSVVQS